MYEKTKRFMDFILSLVALVILSPILFASALGVKLSSKGPVFYRANRIGKDHKKFVMLKFRSMHVEREAKEGSFLPDKDRIFLFGAFLRKSKIDELPQLINVLNGSMSIVGPRPASADNVDSVYIGAYKNIFSVKPGLTSMGSLFDYKHGDLFIKDNDKYIAEVLPVKLNLELMYVDRRNLLMDIYLIFNTIITIFQIVAGKKEFTYNKWEREALQAAAYSMIG